MVSNNFSRALRLLLLTIPACLPLLPQTSGYLSLGTPQKVVGKRGATVETKIPVSVRQGYHVNSNTPSDEYLIPLKLTWKAPGALQAPQTVYPKPTLEKYEFAEKPLSVFTGNFDLVVKFKVSPTATAGPGVAVGQLRYQACSDRACYPPKTLEVSVPYQVD